MHSLSDNDEKVVYREWQIFSLVPSFFGHSDFLGGWGGLSEKLGGGVQPTFRNSYPIITKI